MRVLATVLLLSTLFMDTGCDDCGYEGYTDMRVFLVSDAPNPPVVIRDGVNVKGCIIYTDIPPDTKDPDAYGEAQRHIGESIYKCLTNDVAVVVSDKPETWFYHEQLAFRLDGHCPVKPDFTYYGCFNTRCRTVDTEITHVGPPEICPEGQPMSEWSDDCWTQFYRVLGHEIMHGWLGAFHKEQRNL